MNKLPIISSGITVGSYSEIVDNFFNLVAEKQSSYVCICNVHMLIEAYDSPSFGKIVNNADMVTPDGMPVAKGVSWLYGVKQPRAAGMDLIESLFSEIMHREMKVFLFGSTDDVLQAITKKAKKQFPTLNIVGVLSPPFRELSEEEKRLMVEEINRVEPDFVFVALGCPKQEKWMAEHRGLIRGCMVGLGGAFPVYAGTVARSPSWMQNNGLEWLYRLYKEPRRLWRRYFHTNTKFIWLFGVQYIKQKIFKTR